MAFISKFCLGWHKSPNWVDGIVEDGTLTAHVLNVVSIILTSNSIKWSCVVATFGNFIPLQPDVAQLAPSGVPAVTDQPVRPITGRVSLVNSIANKLDSVVDGNVL